MLALDGTARRWEPKQLRLRLFAAAGEQFTTRQRAPDHGAQAQVRALFQRTVGQGLHVQRAQLHLVGEQRAALVQQRQLAWRVVGHAKVQHLASRAQLGEGTRVWHFVHVSPGARIGEGCSLGQGVYVGNDVTIGRNVKIQNNVSVYDAVTLEDDVFCGPSVVFTNVFNPRAAVSRDSKLCKTLMISGT